MTSIWPFVDAGQKGQGPGGAAGIGAANVRRLLEEGALVAIAHINITGAEKIAAELGDPAKAFEYDALARLIYDAAALGFPKFDASVCVRPGRVPSTDFSRRQDRWAFRA